jgi:hypothetical protein
MFELTVTDCQDKSGVPNQGLLWPVRHSENVINITNETSQFHKSMQ